MKVLICGSRNWANEKLIWDRLWELDNDTEIIQGECKGADIIAKDIAQKMGLDVVGYYANWVRHGRSAGPLRNAKMLEQKPELVIAFHNDINNSKGTKNCINQAKKLGIPVEIICE